MTDDVLPAEQPNIKKLIDGVNMSYAKMLNAAQNV